jgi:hypothetical protein
VLILTPGNTADCIMAQECVSLQILVDDRMDLAVAAAFRETERLEFGPPFPPLAQRWALTWELSNATCSGGSDDAATVANIFCQIPRSLQRGKRFALFARETLSKIPELRTRPQLQAATI